MNYASQKCAAAKRGIAFLLSFEEWLSVWQQSGFFHLRGRGSSKYCMARKGDKGAYVIGNIMIITNCQNVFQQNRFGRKLSEATKRKIGEANRGLKHSEEFKEQQRQRRLGTKLSEETKAKIAASHLGIRPNEKTRAKLRAGQRRRARQQKELLACAS